MEVEVKGDKGDAFEVVGTVVVRAALAVVVVDEDGDEDVGVEGVLLLTV